MFAHSHSLSRAPHERRGSGRDEIVAAGYFGRSASTELVVYIIASIFAAVFALLVGSPAYAEDRVPTSSLPQWLQAAIKRYDAQPADHAPLSIWQIAHNGQVAYFLASPCCDQYDPLLSAEGKHLCSPTGGFTGGGDGRCPKPADAGSAVKLVWIHPQSKEPQQMPPRLGQE
jgi:hypothetical protein